MRADINSQAEKSSVSDLSIARQENFNFNLKIDFSKKVISGSVTSKFRVQKAAIHSLDLDVGSQVVVERITLENQELEFETFVDDSIPKSLDSRTLRITFGKSLEADSSFCLKFHYHTGRAGNIQWLTQQQTQCQKQPYLFIMPGARNLMPCQDRSDAKATYSASIETENCQQVCLMSALSDDSRSDESKNIYGFHQPIPISTYLITLTVGHLAKRPLGPRCNVWAEPALLDACQYEFANTEKFIKIAEGVTGFPYIWSKYDLLVHPPTFPVGGMEFPNLTYTTPTLIAGDRSLENVVAHEICHSWFGNLVTQKNYEHFWLNEGFTVYLERLVLSLMHSPKTGDYKISDINEDLRDLESLNGLADLQSDIDNFGNGHEFTSLVPDLTGVDHGDAFSSVPYEKGYNLLRLIGSKIGEDVFLLWINRYLNDFGTKTQPTTFDFKKSLIDFCAERGNDCLVALNQIDWDLWFHGLGMSKKEDMVKYGTGRLDQCTELAEAWVAGSKDPKNCAATFEQLTPRQKELFFKIMNQKVSCDPKKFDRTAWEKLQTDYNMGSIQNTEIRFNNAMLGLNPKIAADQAWDIAESMARTISRMKFARPLFRAMNGHDRERALKVLDEIKETIHPTTLAMVRKDLGN